MAHTTLKLLAATALIMTGACSKKPKPEDLPPPPMNQPADSGTDAGTGSDTGVGTAALPGSRADFLAQVGSDTVYFGTDSQDLDGEARAALDRQASWLKRYPQTRVTIEGHCDERGTREYNLALGERRALAARNYLAAQGVTAQMSVISYGKERPAAAGSDESAWAQNRRAVSVIIN